MRTTLTIDDDVAAMLERLRKTRDAKLKDLINEALRRGLKEMNRPRKRRKPFRTRTYDAGTPLVADIDNIAEVLAIAEGEAINDRARPDIVLR
jgi:hypothetical protein